MGRIVRVTDPEEAVRLFEAGMLYWEAINNEVIDLRGVVWFKHNVLVEVVGNRNHRLSYIVEDEECDSTTTDSED